MNGRLEPGKNYPYRKRKKTNRSVTNYWYDRKTGEIVVAAMKPHARFTRISKAEYKDLRSIE